MRRFITALFVLGTFAAPLAASAATPLIVIVPPTSGPKPVLPIKPLPPVTCRPLSGPIGRFSTTLIECPVYTYH